MARPIGEGNLEKILATMSKQERARALLRVARVHAKLVYRDPHGQLRRRRPLRHELGDET